MDSIKTGYLPFCYPGKWKKYSGKTFDGAIIFILLHAIMN